MITMPKRDERGFTLIELLVVIIIIGILAAIAIPLFLDQRKLAVDATVKSDVRNTVTAITTAIAQDGTTDPTKVPATQTASQQTAEHVAVLPDPASSGNYIVYGYDDNGKANATAATAFTYHSATGQFTTSDVSVAVAAASKTKVFAFTFGNVTGGSAAQFGGDPAQAQGQPTLGVNDSTPSGAGTNVLKATFAAPAPGLPTYTVDCTTYAATRGVGYQDNVTNLKAYDASGTQLSYLSSATDYLYTSIACGDGVGGTYIRYTLAINLTDSSHSFYQDFDHATFTYGGHNYNWDKSGTVTKVS